MTVRLVLLVLLYSYAAFAGEYAVLANGFRIRAESHVTEGDKVTLRTDKGAIELPACQVSAFEQEEYVAPAAPAVEATALALTPAAPVSVPAAKPLDTRQMVTDAANKAGLPPALIHSLVRAESAYQANAISPKGAIGLMQLMPGTAAALKANPYDPQQNVEAGVAYLRDLLIKYEDDPHQVTKAIAAYNAGPGAVDKYKGIPPYPETINYVNQVVRQYLKTQNSQP